MGNLTQNTKQPAISNLLEDNDAGTKYLKILNPELKKHLLNFLKEKKHTDSHDIKQKITYLCNSCKEPDFSVFNIP